MSGKVVTLREGYSVASPGDPDAELVTALEEMLTEARAGEICGCVIIRSFADGCASYQRAGIIRGTYTVVGALEDVKQKLLA